MRTARPLVLLLVVLVATPLAAQDAPAPPDVSRPVPSEPLPDDSGVPQPSAPAPAEPAAAPAAADAGPADPIAALQSAAEQRYLLGDVAGAIDLYRQLADRQRDELPARAATLLTVAWLEHGLARPEARDTLLEALRTDFAVPFEAGNYAQDFVDLYDAAKQQVAGEREAQAGALVREGVAAIGRDDLAAARRAFAGALAIHPDHPVALYNLALVDMRRSDAAAAIAGFERLLSLAGGGAVIVGPELQAQALNNLGVLYYGRGLFADAEAAERRALALTPDDARAWSNLGLALRRQNRLDEAIAAFQKAALLLPEDDGVAVNLAVALADAKRWSEAVAVLVPRSVAGGPAVWFQLGVARRGLGDLAGAAEAFRKVIALDPGNRAGADRAASFLALTSHEQGDPAATVEAARQALAWKPDDVESLTYLGLGLLAQNDLAAARDALEKAASLAPDRPELANNLGTVYFEQGDDARAEAAFQKALALRPDFPQAATNLANVRQRMAAAAAAAAGASGAAPATGGTRSLGAKFTPIDAAALGLKGLRVDAVSPNAAAGAAGLRKGDLVLLADGREVASEADLEKIVAAATGSTLQLDILRESRPMRVQVRIR